MSYLGKPITCVWEITMGCNMKCMHCGSACENPLPDELTTEEALNLCDDLKEFGLKWLTISGGEPTTRKDWNLIAKRLADNGIVCTMISNGWLFTDELAKMIKNARINLVAFSLDGMKETHDKIRKAGSFDKTMQALDILKENGISRSIVTTIHAMNLGELDEMYEMLSKKGIFAWQLQTAVPMGNMNERRNEIVNPKHIDDIINFAYEKIGKSNIQIHLADCIGYFNNKEIAVRQKMVKNHLSCNYKYNWFGCAAGSRNFGIMHNGDINPCLSIRDPKFIVGNIRETKITELWHNPNNFLPTRTITKNMLSGLCKKCGYGDQCRGGCPNVRLTLDGSIYGENKYCSYGNAVRREISQVNKYKNPKKWLSLAKKLADTKSYQVAGHLLEKYIDKEEFNYEAYALYGFVSFMLGNLEDSKLINQKLLAKFPEDAYSNKGYGITLARMGDIEEGLAYLRKAVELSRAPNMDAFHDLALVLYENRKFEEALNVLEKGFSMWPALKETSENLYKMITIKNK